MKAILLDLDDTLLDDRNAVRVALEALLSAHRDTVHYAEYEEALSSWRRIAARHWIRHQSGELTFVEQRRCRVREFLGRQLSDHEADESFLPYAKSYEASWRLLPGVAQFLQRTKDIPKVIVTNGDREQQLHKVHVTGLSSCVLGVVTPADCGHWKPDPKIFLAAMEMLHAQPEECLMIGDDPICDIEPARKLGMKHFLVEYGHKERNLSKVPVVA
jgi:putative hydrolase of the HAD superfamily